MSEKEIRDIYDNAAFIVNGYAFSEQDNGFVSIINIDSFRIFKKLKEVFYHWDNEYWNFEKISTLCGIDEFAN